MLKCASEAVHTIEDVVLRDESGSLQPFLHKKPPQSNSKVLTRGFILVQPFRRHFDLS